MTRGPLDRSCMACGRVVNRHSSRELRFCLMRVRTLFGERLFRLNSRHWLVNHSNPKSIAP